MIAVIAHKRFRCRLDKAQVWRLAALGYDIYVEAACGTA